VHLQHANVFDSRDRVWLFSATQACTHLRQPTHRLMFRPYTNSTPSSGGGLRVGAHAVSSLDLIAYALYHPLFFLGSSPGNASAGTPPHWGRHPDRDPAAAPPRPPRPTLRQCGDTARENASVIPARWRLRPLQLVAVGLSWSSSFTRARSIKALCSAASIRCSMQRIVNFFVRDEVLPTLSQRVGSRCGCNGERAAGVDHDSPCTTAVLPPRLCPEALGSSVRTMLPVSINRSVALGAHEVRVVPRDLLTGVIYKRVPFVGCGSSGTSG